ncbi:6-phospho-3-hexuloisomerase [Methanocaldococcus fervens]|uniref:6-phospho 3-hexuloisomerase n=1 Tax=Methanocaldococcus fervens (strain DSM 4213 / JCM 15782 / AG86) TaxID=573064 RepID=C7P6M6_METFA|nr:6-phospho-3-hexuloisomerase [Methanocaldococcus fervens]ACV24208.1 6-phospho 3-hexuloisomerase [Methanocaldococcus fervens AG86]
MDELEVISQNILMLKKFYTNDEWKNRLNSLVDRIIKAKKIFVFGVGRSGYIGRCFAMRLMHLGFDSYFVGEATTPSYEKDDLLILISGSGRTESVLTVAKKAAKINNNIVAIVCECGNVVEFADITIQLDVKKSKYLPMGTTFEETALIFLDLVIAEVMKRLNLDESVVIKRHCNLL